VWSKQVKFVNDKVKNNGKKIGINFVEKNILTWNFRSEKACFLNINWNWKWVFHDSRKKRWVYQCPQKLCALRDIISETISYKFAFIRSSCLLSSFSISNFPGKQLLIPPEGIQKRFGTVNIFMLLNTKEHKSYDILCREGKKLYTNIMLSIQIDILFAYKLWKYMEKLSGNGENLFHNLWCNFNVRQNDDYNLEYENKLGNIVEHNLKVCPAIISKSKFYSVPHLQVFGFDKNSH
jgi:hypothetical protein